MWEELPGEERRGRLRCAGADHCRRLAPGGNRFLAVSLQISPDPAGREDGCFSIRAGAGPDNVPEKSIAVLPFDNLSRTKATPTLRKASRMRF